MTTFTNNNVASGDVVRASDHNEQGSRLASVLNGNIDNANINASAAIAGSKLADASVTMPKITNPYKFRVTKSGDQTGITDAVITKVTWDTETFDTNNNFASNTYTVPVTGYYQINYVVGIKGSTDTIVASVALLYKNGVEFKRQTLYPRTGFGEGSEHGHTYSDLLYLTASDTIDVYAYADVASGTATVKGGGYGSFSGYLVSIT